MMKVTNFFSVKNEEEKREKTSAVRKQVDEVVDTFGDV